ncbi:MAG: helix-turn-helix transcriptional regulator, partial [Desulfobacterales bacterium]
MSPSEPLTVAAAPELLPAVCPCTGLPVKIRPEWIYTNPARTYRTTIALIGDRIFWVIPRGYVADQDMQQAIALAVEILAEVNPDGRPFVFIENFAHTWGGTTNARRRYLQFTNDLQGLLGSFPYGMPPFFRLSFNLSRRLGLHRYRVHMVAHYEDAVTAALARLQKHSVSPMPGYPPGRHVRPARSHSAVARGVADPVDPRTAHVDGLLSLLGRLDLESPGLPDTAAPAPPEVLQPVYDLLEMLKMDMDQLLEEQRELMAVHREGQRELLERATAIAASNHELQGLLRQSSADQRELGQTARRNVQNLLRPLVRLIERECTGVDQHRWLERLKVHMDELEKDLDAHLDLRDYELTPQEMRIARLIRGGLRSKAIAGQLGLSVRTVESLRGR